MHTGQAVTVTCYGDKKVIRSVVSVENGKVYVCKQDELKAATRENRAPVCIGFSPQDVDKSL